MINESIFQRFVGIDKEVRRTEFNLGLWESTLLDSINNMGYSDINNTLMVFLQENSIKNDLIYDMVLLSNDIEDIITYQNCE